LRTVDQEAEPTDQRDTADGVRSTASGSGSEATESSSHSTVTAANRRLVVELTPDTAIKLASLAAEEGHNKTTVVNRALQVYDFLREIDANGGKILIQESGSREQQWLRLL
jgi:hypothetical protein